MMMACRYDAGVEIEVSKTGSSYDVLVKADPVRPMMLHWAVNEWQLPPSASWPAGTNQVPRTITAAPLFLCLLTLYHDCLFVTSVWLPLRWILSFSDWGQSSYSAYAVWSMGLINWSVSRLMIRRCRPLSQTAARCTSPFPQTNAPAGAQIAHRAWIPLCCQTTPSKNSSNDKQFDPVSELILSE